MHAVSLVCCAVLALVLTLQTSRAGKVLDDICERCDYCSSDPGCLGCQQCQLCQNRKQAGCR